MIWRKCPFILHRIPKQQKHHGFLRTAENQALFQEPRQAPETRCESDLCFLLEFSCSQALRPPPLASQKLEVQPRSREEDAHRTSGCIQLHPGVHPDSVRMPSFWGSALDSKGLCVLWPTL